jgi:neutral trehalase
MERIDFHIFPFKKFLEETKSEKNRCYTKSSYLVEKATNNFKKELILDMIETHIQDHPYYGSAVNQLFSMHVDDAMLALRKAYQAIHQ